MKRIFLSVICFMLVATLYADVVTPEQAKQIASQFLMANSANSPARRGMEPTTLSTDIVFNAVNSAGQPYLYSVTTAGQNGYVLVSGDDRFAPILGFSDSHNFNEQQMPENMRSWLQGYVDQMRYLDSIGYQPSLSAPRGSVSVMASVSPLVQTQWDQDAPYNNLCPVDRGYHSVTGCVATAMAQLINYHIQTHNAPTAIAAEIEGYTTYSYGLSVATVPAGTLLPDKTLLLNTYNNSATDEQNTAVAQLMLYCGASVQMNYSRGSSSASSSGVPDALINNFGFDSTTRLVKRDDNTYAEWLNLVYHELEMGRPVYMSAASSGGGHAFIVDGYYGDELFHVNWGWSGYGDDYFALSVMNPDDNGQIGASASNDGYTLRAEAVIGAQIGSGESYEKPICMTAENYSVNGQSVVYSTYNMTGETHSFYYGAGFIDENGVITPINTYGPYTYQYGYGRYNLTAYISTDITLANTTKKIVPISKEENSDTWYVSPNPDIYYFSAEYDANGVPQLTVHPITNLSGTISVPTSKFVNEEQVVELSLTNNADEFYGPLYLFASTSNSMGSYKMVIGVTSLVNSTNRFSFPWTPTATGTYNLWITTDQQGANVISSNSVTITEDISLAGKSLAIMSCFLDNQDNSSYQISANGTRSIDVYGNLLSGSVGVQNLTASTISGLNLSVYFERYNETTGQYEADNYPWYYSGISINSGYGRYLYFDRTLTPGNKYRICLVNLTFTNGYTTNTEYLDTRYVVNLRNLVDYNITYNLNGGTVETANPATYNFASESILLNNPTRPGYIFAGWTGTDISDSSMSVIIYKGSKGDRTYTALWTRDPNNPDILGDVNEDGVVNVMDATVLIGAYLNNSTNQLPASVADVNHDGVINVMDATEIINIFLNNR